MDAYGEAWLTPGSPLEADALTVNPFLGVGTLDGHASRWPSAAGKGVFVLAATSNPEALRGAARALGDGCDGRGERSSPRSRSATPAITPRRRVGEHRLRDRRDRRLGGCRAPAVHVRPRRSSARDSGTRAPDPPISPAASASWRRCVIASESRSILEPARTRLARGIEARASEYRGTVADRRAD